MYKIPISPMRRDRFETATEYVVFREMVICSRQSDTVYQWVPLRRGQYLFDAKQLSELLNRSTDHLRRLIGDMSKKYQRFIVTKSFWRLVVTLVWYDDLIGMKKWHIVETSTISRWQVNDKSPIIECKDCLLIIMSDTSDDIKKVFLQKEKKRAGNSLPSPSPSQDQKGNFVEFWKYWPRKDKKKPAIKKYDMIIKSREATHETIMLWLHKRLANFRKSGKDKQFIPLPTTWLNESRREDEWVIKFAVPPLKEASPAKIIQQTVTSSADPQLVKDTMAKARQSLKSLPTTVSG